MTPPMHSALVLLVALPGLAFAACSPPSAGASLQSLDCATPGATFMFAFTQTNAYTGAGQYSVPGTQLCAAVSGTIPSDGSPAIQLQPCPAKAGADAAYIFTPMLDGSMVSNVNGWCLDLVSGVQAPNEVCGSVESHSAHVTTVVVMCNSPVRGIRAFQLSVRANQVHAIA